MPFASARRYLSNICQPPLARAFPEAAISVLLGLLVLLTPAAGAADSGPRELVILTWSEYMDPAMIAAFEKAHHARVREVYFDSDDGRDQILLQTNAEGFDLILVNGAVVDSYRRRGWLQPLPTRDIPNLALIEPRWQNAFPAAQGYGAPYFWGTLGIAYRKDLVDAPITSWQQFFRPSTALCGRILAVKSSRDLIGMALKTLGHSTNSEDPAALREAEALLLAQKPCVARYGYITLEPDSSLVQGSIVAAMVYGGDALNVGEHHDQITYVLPEEGGNIWVDYFTLAAKARHPKLAAAFLDFINQPAWAATNAEEMYLATPNREAIQRLPEAMRQDPVIFPDEQVLARSEFHRPLSPRSERSRAAVFARVVE